MNDDILYTYMKSPNGSVLLARNEAGLIRIDFQDGPRPYQPAPQVHCRSLAPVARLRGALSLAFSQSGKNPLIRLSPDQGDSLE